MRNGREIGGEGVEGSNGRKRDIPSPKPCSSESTHSPSALAAPSPASSPAAGSSQFDVHACVCGGAVDEELC